MNLFHLVQRCEIAAIMRGGNDNSLVKARLSRTIGQSRSHVRGGINSGIVMLKLCTTVFENMMRYMKIVFKPRPHGGEAEQDLISEFLGHYCPQ